MNFQDENLPLDTNTAKKTIEGLVLDYQRMRDTNELESLTEEETKKNFILPLFKALGWRTDTTEVSAEETISRKRVDYGFRISNIPKFFLEAKSFKEGINKQEYVDQAVNYSWHKGTTWSVLTDFATLKVYNAELKRRIDNLFFEIKADDYLARFDDQLRLLSRESVAKGELDKVAERWGKKSKKTPVGTLILQDLMTWRNLLFNDVKSKNEQPADINHESVQRIINRLIFIRTTEDRTIEPSHLMECLHEWQDPSSSHFSLLRKINEIFRQYDTDYDSELFLPHQCESLNISDRLLSRMIGGLYNSRDKYVRFDFSAIDADVLGNIYEQYLGHIQKSSVEKNYRRQRGIYYTPTYIVDFIVKTALSAYLRQNGSIEKIRVLDCSAGSGSFLLRAFDLIVKIRLGVEESNQQQRNLDNEMSVKTQVLTQNIFGVDVDSQAVEIARLNLLLKATVRRERLPALRENIQTGNSLFSSSKIEESFQWNERFSSIGGNFDIIVGNPPYVGWAEISRKERQLLETGEYLDCKYACRPNHADAQPNYYLFFIVRALNLLEEGVCSFIIPQEWLHHNFAQDFRDYLLGIDAKITIVAFNPTFKVFKSAYGDVGTNSMILIVDKTRQSKEVTRYYIDSLDEMEVRMILGSDNLASLVDAQNKEYNELKGRPWMFEDDRAKHIKQKILSLNGLVSLSDADYFDVKGGFQPPVEEAKNFEISESELAYLSRKEQGFVFPLVFDAFEIERYHIERTGRYWILLNDLERGDLKDIPNLRKLLRKKIEGGDEWWKFPNIRNFELVKNYGKKILAPRTADKPSFALDTEHSVFKGTNTMIISKVLPIEYVLGILNSKLSDYWYGHFGYEYHGGKTKKYEPEKVKEYSIPIRIAEKKQQNEVSQLVSQLIKLRKKIASFGDDRTNSRLNVEDEIRRLDAQLDDTIFSIYEMDKEKVIIAEDTN